MGKLRYEVSMSLDGYVAGDDMSIDNPLGVNGDLLHRWLYELRAWREKAGLEGGVSNESTEVIEENEEDTGAFIMGRNMFGGGPGPWGGERWGAAPWRGWWGEDPPFHAPVFVLTHYEREPLTMLGGTSFTFVTGGIHDALALARQAAGGKDVAVGGGSTARQYLTAGLVDELKISLVPVLLGAGVRLFDGLDFTGVPLEQVRAVAAPGVTHLTYRVNRG
jgi:dihydrofolate reductase